MAKAIAGGGSIRKRLSGKLAGKWRVQWSYDDPMSNDLTTVDRTFPTQAEAARFLKELKARVHTGQKIEESNTKKALTLNAWFDDLAGTSENLFRGPWIDHGDYRDDYDDTYAKNLHWLAKLLEKELDWVFPRRAGDRLRVLRRRWIEWRLIVKEARAKDRLSKQRHEKKQRQGVLDAAKQNQSVGQDKTEGGVEHEVVNE